MSNNIIYVMIDDIVGNQCAVNPGLLMGIRGGLCRSIGRGGGIGELGIPNFRIN